MSDHPKQSRYTSAMQDSFVAECSYCGGVALLPESAQMYVCTDKRIPWFWSFTCPLCQRRSVQWADAKSPATWMGRVQRVAYGFPAELTEAHSGPPLTWDDLLDFHFETEEFRGFLDPWEHRCMPGADCAEGWIDWRDLEVVVFRPLVPLTVPIDSAPAE